MSKQKNAKTKSKFTSALMTEFNKKVSKKKTNKKIDTRRRGYRRIKGVTSMREESEVQRQKYFTREKQDYLKKGKKNNINFEYKLEINLL